MRSDRQAAFAKRAQQKVSGEAKHDGGACGGRCVGVRSRGVRAKEGQSKSSQRLAGASDAAVSGRPDRHLNARGSLAVGRQGCEDAGEGIGRRTVEEVVELGIAADGEQIGAQPQVGRPSVFVTGGKDSVVRKTFNRGIGIVGCELRGDRYGELRRYTTEEGARSSRARQT